MSTFYTPCPMVAKRTFSELNFEELSRVLSLAPFYRQYFPVSDVDVRLSIVARPMTAISFAI